MKLVEGMRVIVRIHGAGTTSEEEHTIGKVEGNKVWLESDEDMTDESAYVNGRKTGIFGFWFELLPMKESKNG